MIQRAAQWLVFFAALLVAGQVFAAEPYFRPSQGNLYRAKTAKYLYVIWAVPNDLAPFTALHGKAEIEELIARTAIFLCKEHVSVDPNPATPCKVQVVRMSSNDEYTKSAAGGFKTIATVVLDKSRANDATLQKSLTLKLPDLLKLFARFEVHHDRLGPK